MKQFAPATERNREPICEVLKQHLPSTGKVLEIASGTGQHVAYFAKRFPSLTWIPSEPEASSRESIRDWTTEDELANVLPPLPLNVLDEKWAVDKADAILNINMIHISPWETTTALMKGASTVLQKGAPLILYGPFIEDGVETAPSNVDFHHWLRARNPEFGIRRLDKVTEVAEAHGFKKIARFEMPANNLSVVFEKL